LKTNANDINTKLVLIQIKSTRNFAEYPNLTKSQTNPTTLTEEIYLQTEVTKKAQYIEKLSDHLGYLKLIYRG